MQLDEQGKGIKLILPVISKNIKTTFTIHCTMSDVSDVT